MKKIININLSGRVIPIEDTAYESLQRYIESLRRYFAHEEGRDEIINDIESRIAELMNEKVRKGAGAITDADMNEIIASMGRVEDFEEVDAAENATADPYAEAAGAYAGADSRRRYKGRLYRNTSDKIIGGVCSGIANYMNFDPAVVRLLFAIVTFGGFGFGVLVYLLLWIILPARDLETYVGKRLFRNPDDRIIAGVAGGLGAYFHQPAWIVRLIFAGPLLLNILFGTLNGIFFAFHRDIFPNFFFGSFTGTFILTYIILWIVLPEARTQYDKMEMRGETIDVNSIRQNVKDEMEQIRTRAKAWGEEVKTSAQQFSARATEFANTRGKTFASELSETARPVASGIGHAIGVLFKAFFLFIAGSIAFGLFVALIVLIFGGGAALWPAKQHILDFGLDGFWEYFFFWGTVLLFFAVPLIAFITWLVRRIFKVRSRRHYLGYTFGGLWLIGIICLAGLVSSLVRDTRYYEVVRQDVAIRQPPYNRMLVTVNEPELHYGGDLWFTDDDNRGWDITADSLKLGNIKISVIKSNDSNYAVTLWKESRGADRESANERAQLIQYPVNYADSVLNLGSGYSIARSHKFRGQDVIVEIKVPVGKKIRFDRSIIDKLHPTNVHIRDGRGWTPHNYDINSFDYQPNVDYTMMAGGSLQSELGATPGNGSIDDYEYRNDKEDLQQQYEEQKRKAEEEQQRLKELEQQLQRNKAADSATKEETTVLLKSPFSPLFI